VRLPSVKVAGLFAENAFLRTRRSPDNDRASRLAFRTGRKRLGRCRFRLRLNNISDRAELFRGDFEGAQASGVIVDLAGGDDFVGVSLFE